MKKPYLLFVTVILTCYLNAQDLPLFITNKLYLDYKIQTSLLVSRKTVERKIEEGILLRSTNQLQNMQPEQAYYRAEQIARKVLTEIVITSRQSFTSISEPLNQFFVIAKIDSVLSVRENSFKNTFVKIARLHGISAATVWFSSEFAQIVSLPVTAALGVPQYGIMLAASPLSFINLAIALKIINFSNNIRNIKAYGGYHKKRKATRIQRNMLKTLGVKNENSIIHVVETKNDSSTIISINRNNFLIDLGSFFRLNQHKAYYRNIKLFCEKNLPDDTLKQLLHNKKFSKQMRCLYAFEYISSFKPMLLQDFSTKFYKSVKVLPDISGMSTVNTGDIQWVYNLCAINNLNELEIFLEKNPGNLKVYEVLELFDDVIIKYWAVHMNQTKFRTFRKFVKGFKKTKYQLLQQSDELFTQKHADLLLLNCKLL